MTVAALVLIIAAFAVCEGAIGVVRSHDLFAQVASAFAGVLGIILFIVALGWWFEMYGEPAPRLTLEQACRAHADQTAGRGWSWVCP